MKPKRAVKKKTAENVRRDQNLAFLLLCKIESYLDITENPFVSAQEQSVSAFALDTSTAGYANIRRMSIKKNFLSLWKNIINGWK
ncbi:MAG: von Willebrand factor type A domain-containing protein [Bacilli bacterium]